MFVDGGSISEDCAKERQCQTQAAQDYIKKKEWRIAAECLQSLLETPDDSFVEVKRKDATGKEQDLKVSVRDAERWTRRAH